MSAGPAFKYLPLCLVVVCLVVVVFAGACDDGRQVYIDEVLEREGNISAGRAQYETNCVGCHGMFREGLDGPALTAFHLEFKSDAYLADQVLFGGGGMPGFFRELTTQEVADVLAFLRTP